MRAYFDEDYRETLKGKAGFYKKTVETEHGGVAVREYYMSKNLQIMKKIRYILSLDYENEIEKMLSMLDLDSIREALE